MKSMTDVGFLSDYTQASRSHRNCQSTRAGLLMFSWD